MFLLRKDDLWEIQLHFVRRVLDLQFQSICLKIEKYRYQTKEVQQILDFGAGRAPWKRFFTGTALYSTLDPAGGADFSHLAELPAAIRPDLILLFEVLEHVENPKEILVSLHQKIAPDGRLWVSVPFNARVHGAPNDFLRWTAEGLTRQLNTCGWEVEILEPRGSDWSTLASKWIFFLARRIKTLWMPISILTLILTMIPLVIFSQISLLFNLGMKDDPLGWFVIAKPCHKNTNL